MKKQSKIFSFDKKQNAIIALYVFSGIVCIILESILRVESSAESINQLTVILFAAMITVSGIWITYYFLILQLYKNSYPLVFIEREKLPEIKYYLILIMINIVWGFLSMLRSNNLWSQIGYCILTIILILVVFFKLYRTNKTLMLNTYVDDFCNSIEDKLKSSSYSINDNVLDDIYHIIDETIFKEEYFVTQNLTKRLGEIFRIYLENSIKYINQENEDVVRRSFEKIIDLNMYQLDACTKIRSDLLVDQIVIQQMENIMFCIKSSQYEWFKLYIEEYLFFVFQVEQNADKSDLPIVQFYYPLSKVSEKLIDKEKNNWFDFLNEKFYSMVVSLSFSQENSNTQHATRFFSKGIVYSFDKNDNTYKSSVKYFLKYSSLICKSGKEFKASDMSYLFVFNEIIKKNPKEAFEFFKKIEKAFSSYTDDKYILEFQLYCINELYSKIPKSEEETHKELLDIHINVLTNVFGLKGSSEMYYFFPDFKKMILEKQYEISKVEEIIDKIKDLLYKAIIKENVQSYYFILKKVVDIIASPELRQKDIQISFFNFFIYSIERTCNISNRQFLEISIGLMQSAINELDKNKAISENFCKIIIEKLTSVARERIDDDVRIVNYITEILYTFVNKDDALYFAISSNENRKGIYRALFNIGTICLENEYEIGLRKVSNSIGWLLIQSIDRNSSTFTNYLLDRANTLYLIAKKMQVSHKTKIFMLTLFTTVGTYCCKDSPHLIITRKICDMIKKESNEDIKLAIDLRTNENDMWDSLYGNQTKVLTDKFWQQLKSQKK